MDPTWFYADKMTLDGAGLAGKTNRLEGWGFGALISARHDLLTSRERVGLETEFNHTPSDSIVKKKNSGHWGASWLGNTLMMALFHR